jgi:hypothetical protein
MPIQPSGDQPWAVLQVTVQPTANARSGAFNPARALPNGLQLADLFTRPSITGDLPFDLFFSQSFQRVTIKGSKVFGPFAAIRKDGIQATTDDWDLFNDDPANNVFNRSERILCGIRGALATGIDLSPFWGVVVVPDYQIDSFGSYGSVGVSGITKQMGQALLDYNDLSSAHCLHEMGHGFGFSHTRGDFNPYPGGDYGDPSDVMSYAQCLSYNGTDGKTGPSYSAASLWLRGWLPGDVTVVNAQAGIADATYNIAPLHAALVPGSTRAVLVSVMRAGEYVDQELYFIEYRDGQGIDAGIPRPAVFVHRLRSIHGVFENSPWLVGPNTRSSAVDQQGLVAGGGGWTDAAAGFGVGVEKIDPGTNTATVRINPASATISVSYNLETLSEEEAGAGAEEWPGAILATSPECAPREFEYVILHRQQRVTLSATPGGGLDPAHAVKWFVEGATVAVSGPITFELAYESPKRLVTLDATVNGQTLVLSNHPVDGTIKFYIDVFADPAVPGVGSSNISLQFDGIGRRYTDPQHDQIIEHCQEESSAALRGVLGRLALRRQVSPWEPVERISQEYLQELAGTLEEAAAQLRQQ